MKFEDLVFVDHRSGMGKQARVDFPNGYGASIVSGEWFYTRRDAPYELAVFHGDHLCYDTPLTNDVLGYLTKEDVSGYLKKIEELPSNP
jgi:hypothetical protein